MISFVYFAEINKEKVLYWLERDEPASRQLVRLWREKVNTTNLTTVRELFERYETAKGSPLSTDDLKDLLRDLGCVDVTSCDFPQTLTSTIGSTGKF